MSAIRIVHVVYETGTGGTELGVRKLVNALDGHGFEHTICAVTGRNEWGNMGPANFVALGCQPGRASFSIPKLARVFHKLRPHVVHSRNWAAIEAIPAARMARVPATIHSEHGRDLPDLGRSPWRRRCFRRMCYHLADRVFAVSHALKRHYISEMGDVAERLEVIPNGVDVQRFHPDADCRKIIRQQLGVDDQEIVVGSLGRLDPVKDHGTLLRAAERCIAAGMPIRLLIVGDGSTRIALEREIENSALLRRRSIFAGEVSDVATWLNAFDVYVLSSLCEGMSNTLLEAMATALPVIATDVGGNTEVVEVEHSGLLYETRDVTRLTEHLTCLVQNQGRRRDLGRAARQRVESIFSFGFMLERYSNLYQEVAGRATERGMIRVRNMRSV